MRLQISDKMRSLWKRTSFECFGAVIVSACMFCSSVADADSYPPARPEAFTSPSGAFLVRKQAAATVEDPLNYWPETEFIVYKFDQQSEGYLEASRFTGKGHPLELFIDDAGRYIIAIDECFGMGSTSQAIVVYSTDGKLLRMWKLRDLNDQEDGKPQANPSLISGNKRRPYWRGETAWSPDQKALWFGRPVAAVETRESGAIVHVYAKDQQRLALDLCNLTVTER